MTRHIDVKETAQIIRGTLKEAFPGVKFSTRLSRYSGGCSIDVSWTDGPVRSQVDPILDRFNGKGLDGMTDCSYYCGRRTWKGEQVDFCSGYVRGQRRESPALVLAVATRVAQECGVPVPELDHWGGVSANHNYAVPFQWHPHWHRNGAGDVAPLTGKDLLGTTMILASDRHQGEYFTRLIDRIAQWVSLKPHQRPVQLPEYLPEEKGDAA